MKTPRIEWIDVLRGVGIILVVLGHCFSGLTREIIYSFHMPLFFALGGLLYRPSTDYKAFFKHKAQHLMIPYLTFLVIFYGKVVVKAILYAVNHSTLVSLKGIAITLFNGVYGGQVLRGETSAFWFITCFLVTQQIFNYLFTQFDRKQLAWMLVGSFVLSYVNQYSFQSWAFPGAINVALAALPYFGLGVFLQGRMFNRSLNRSVYLGSGLIALLGLGLILNGMVPKYDMKYVDYGFPVLSFGLATAAIVLLMGLSQWLSQFDRIKAPFTYVGSASMVILYVHQSIQMQVKATLGEEANLLRFGVSLLVSLMAYQVITQFPILRAFCLGSAKDLQRFLPQRTKTTAIE
jgi:polysaccharide biosynthesis protein PslL